MKDTRVLLNSGINIFQGHRVVENAFKFVKYSLTEVYWHGRNRYYEGLSLRILYKEIIAVCIISFCSDRDDNIETHPSWISVSRRIHVIGLVRDPDLSVSRNLGKDTYKYTNIGREQN